MTTAELAKTAAIKAINSDDLNLAASLLVIAKNSGSDEWWLTDSAESAAASLESVATYDQKRHEECGLRSAAADMIRQYLAD